MLRAAEERLETFVRESARLLRVAGDSEALSLLFDRGALQVSLEGGGLALEVVRGAQSSGAGERQDESEPWWRVIGAPLMGAWSTLAEGGELAKLELQLRKDGERPLIVSLAARGRALVARAIEKASWDAAH